MAILDENKTSVESAVFLRDVLLSSPSSVVEVPSWFLLAINKDKAKYSSVRPLHYPAIVAFFQDEKFRPDKWSEAKAEVSDMVGRPEENFTSEDWLEAKSKYAQYVNVYAKDNLDQVLREFGFLI